MLELNNIVKFYEGEPLLSGISFQVRTSEIVCLLGSSGSGKSTLLRIIAGIEKADSGKIRWQTRDITTTPTHLREFGLMFQDYALFPHMNVAENVAFGLRMQHKAQPGAVEQRVKEMLALVSMQDFSHRKVTDLSGGEQQRIALARALAPWPKLLMLDEPLAATDRALRESLGRELARVIRKADVPVIYVTHDQEEAFSVADQIALLHEGKIAQMATPQEIYKSPASLWVADFLGFTNRVPGEVQANGGSEIETKIGKFHLPDKRCDLSVGKKVVVVIPQEAIQVVSESNRSIDARVIESIYKGKNIKIRAECNGVELSFEHNAFVEPGKNILIKIDQNKALCYQR